MTEIEERYGPRLWMCPNCGMLNIYFENLPVCISCSHEVDWEDIVFDDQEGDIF